MSKIEDGGSEAPEKPPPAPPETGDDGFDDPVDDISDSSEPASESGHIDDDPVDDDEPTEFSADPDKTRKETEFELGAKALEDVISKDCGGAVNELGASGGMGYVVDAVVTFYKEGWEGAKIIADGWVDGLKKELADKGPSLESEDFKQRSAEMYDQAGRGGEDFKQRSAEMYDQAGRDGDDFKRRSADRYDQVERQGEEVKDTAGGNVENQALPAEPGEKTPPAQPRDEISG